MIYCVSPSAVDEEHILSLGCELERAVLSGNQSLINEAFRRMSANPQIPREFRGEIIGRALKLLSGIDTDSTREATSYITGVPIAAYGL